MSQNKIKINLSHSRKALICPHCGAPVIKKDLHGLTMFECQNLMCGACISFNGPVQIAPGVYQAVDPIANFERRSSIAGYGSNFSSRHTDPVNNALSLDELRAKKGKPVWIEDLIHKKVSTWIIIDEFSANTMFSTSGVRFSFDLYDKTWLSYAREPVSK